MRSRSSLRELIPFPICTISRLQPRISLERKRIEEPSVSSLLTMASSRPTIRSYWLSWMRVSRAPPLPYGVVHLPECPRQCVPR